MVTVESLDARFNQFVTHLDGITARVTAIGNEVGQQTNLINPIRAELAQLKPEPKLDFIDASVISHVNHDTLTWSLYNGVWGMTPDASFVRA